MIDCLRPLWPDAPRNVHCLTTMRSGGVSKPPFDDGAGGGGLNLGLHVGDEPAAVFDNRSRLRKTLPAEPVWLNQVHGTHVVDASAATGTPSADASFSTASNVVCCIMSADCLPVLLCDRAGSIVGAAHAGWKGLLNGVLATTVTAMRDVATTDIVAWLGPAIGPESFEVGEEVQQSFVDLDSQYEQAFCAVPNRHNKFLADIYALAGVSLRSVGVSNITGGDFCTYKDAARFYSYRRDGRTGRMASLIWLE